MNEIVRDQAAVVVEGEAGTDAGANALIAPTTPRGPATMTLREGLIGRLRDVARAVSLHRPLPDLALQALEAAGAE
jgi:hypothetical protein